MKFPSTTTAFTMLIIVSCFLRSLSGMKIWTQKFKFASFPAISKAAVANTLLSISFCSSLIYNPTASFAKTELPSLEKCFGAIEKELDPINGESLIRLKDDIDGEKWEDLKLFTREYDAGFRGGVLKSAWKQFDSELQKKGIEISNSFTFDLIALNKAARNKDPDEASRRLEDVKTDLINFLSLKSQI